MDATTQQLNVCRDMMDLLPQKLMKLVLFSLIYLKDSFNALFLCIRHVKHESRQVCLGKCEGRLFVIAHRGSHHLGDLRL
jgi:hypothetical protein